jgi:microcystin degradation protein MlrC
MRIAVGQLWQETNTFNPLPTTRRNFEEWGVSRGADLVEQMADTNELGGFIQSLRTWPERPEIVGLVRLPAWPGGTATNDTFLWLREEMLAAVRHALPLDGLLLALHGALVADGAPDVEGEILTAVRQIIGPQVPLVATLDLHANVTERMVQNADALVLFHTVPHLDVFETGQRGAAVLRRILHGARPVSAFVKLPMVVPADRANTQDPASVSYGFRERLQALEQHPGILTAGLATVQPWLDIPDLGCAVVVVADGDRSLAESECTTLSREVWRRRREYLGELVPVEEAVRRAHEHRGGLVVLSDCADATTSGAPGDSTWVLRELLKYNWPRLALVTLVAPDVVVQARQTGIGSPFEGPLGGARDNRYSTPITFRGQVAELFETRFVLSGHLAKNLPIDMGPSAVLRSDNVHVVVTSRSGPHFAPELFRAAGLDPFSAGVLVAKSPCGFRAAYAEKAELILVVQAPGCAPADFWNYEYRERPRPLWPWEELGFV